MFKNFDDIEQYILGEKIKKRLVLCGAHDEAVLEAVVNAKRKGVITGILIGDKPKILELLAQMEENDAEYEIIHEPRELRSAKMAVQFIKEGRADIQMKGSMQSSLYLMPIMDPENGLLPQGAILSETTVFYYPDRNCLLFATDCALNIAPTLEEKVKLVKNAANLAKVFGYEKVKVAVVSALESVNDDMPSTVDAEKLTKMEWDEEIILEGPFALDNALDINAAIHKGIISDVAGNADILLMPELCAGNILHKSIHFIGHLPSAGVVCGTIAPVVFTSRTDSADTKYNSIMSAILQSLA
jgi:Phosphotransacetylase